VSEPIETRGPTEGSFVKRQYRTGIMKGGSGRGYDETSRNQWPCRGLFCKGNCQWRKHFEAQEEGTLVMPLMPSCTRELPTRNVTAVAQNSVKYCLK
jgi:hypothetical protein